MKSVCSFLFVFFLIVSVKSQLVTDSVLIGNHYRIFHYYRPDAADKKESLLFVLHGSSGSAMEVMKTAVTLENTSKPKKLLLVYPDGYKHFWNECRTASTADANKENIDEGAFFTAMISYCAEKYGINKKKVFAIGTSGGGHMAYKLALTMPQQFSAITAVVASLPVQDNLDCTPSGMPVAVLIINGTKDTTNPYTGGLVKLDDGTNMGYMRSTEKTFTYWASLAGYKGDPLKEMLPDTHPDDGQTIERYTYSQAGKPEVQLLKVIGGKHAYPSDVDAYLEAWKFFVRSGNNAKLKR